MRYSSSDLQQIVCDDKLLNDLLETTKLTCISISPAHIYRGNGVISDSQGNTYNLEFDYKPYGNYIKIDDGVRIFKDIDEYRVWVLLLKQYDVINHFKETQKIKKTSWWKIW